MWHKYSTTEKAEAIASYYEPYGAERFYWNVVKDWSGKEINHTFNYLMKHEPFFAETYIPPLSFLQQTDDEVNKNKKCKESA